MIAQNTTHVKQTTVRVTLRNGHSFTGQVEKIRVNSQGFAFLNIHGAHIFDHSQATLEIPFQGEPVQPVRSVSGKPTDWKRGSNDHQI